MTDSRAALEEAARIEDWINRECFPELEDIFTIFATQNTGPLTRGELAKLVTPLFAKFAEQESCSLKLLLSAMWKGVAWPNALGELTVGFDGEYSFPVELDSSGIPVLTPEILEALKNAAIF